MAPTPNRSQGPALTRSNLDEARLCNQVVEVRRHAAWFECAAYLLERGHVLVLWQVVNEEAGYHRVEVIVGKFEPPRALRAG